MELGVFIRAYRKERNLSVRAFAEILSVSKFRLQKWEQGGGTNFEDSQKILEYFGVSSFENFSEEFLKEFRSKQKKNGADMKQIDDLLAMKNQLLEEKDKRISNLEDTVNILKGTLADCEERFKGLNKR